MTYKTSSNQEAESIADKLMSDRSCGIICLTSKETAVVYGSRRYVNIPACIRRGVYTYQAAHIAGAIVCFPGDLSIMQLKIGQSDFGSNAIDAVRDYLVSCGCSAEIDGNDLMVGGMKCGSWACMIDSGYAQTVVHFSVSVDVELIRSICTKPMVKTPGALGKYGVTADVLLEVVRCLL